MFWFRDLSWFAIHDVTIDGATTNEREIRARALEQGGARDMTTLHVKDGELARRRRRRSRRSPR